MKQRNKRKKIVRGAWVTVAVCLLVGMIGSALYLAPYASAKMDTTLLNVSVNSEPSVLYVYEPTHRAARAGEMHAAPNATLAAPHPRVHVTYDDLPPHLVNAFVAIEDKRFWQHDGVDLLRTARAGMHYLTGHDSFGGSTITQQLIKNLTGNDAHSLDRKLTEIFQALDLEKQSDKRTIMEAYLNVINLAEGCFGVGAAAERYFSKSVSELTLAECATLAAITQNPTRYDPLLHPEKNITRRNLILREMASQGYISEEERDEALRADLSLSPSVPVDFAPITSWYADMVISDVIRDLQSRNGYSYAAASMLVYQGGLRIECAMDERLQAQVERYYADTAHFPTGEGGHPQSSFILMDPHTGDILAVAGAVGEKRGNRLQNYATDTRRPAGSCIKPLSVYAPALENGLITWASIYEDEPITERQGSPWPSNADGLYRGRVTVGEAMAQSINTVSVRILTELGQETAFDFAKDRLGLTSLIASDDGAAHDLTLSSLALGQQSRGVTVRELTSAYTAFSDGIYRAPISYHRVLDREGNLLLENRPADESARALSGENAAVMTRLLTTVTERGTAARYITLTDTLGIEAAGKTGTTQNNCDRWFVGYTPRLLAGVWMGYDYPAEMRGVQGNPCVSIWNDLMTTCETLYQGEALKNTFDIPPNVIELDFCPLSGSIPNAYCSDPICGCPGERGWFVRGTEPQSICDLHEEPLIHIVPEDPADPDRIPVLPNDILPEDRILPPIGSERSRTEKPSKPWYSRWFSFFSRPTT